jgi:hypothetical protein
LLVIAALMAGPFGCGSSSSPVSFPTAGLIEVAFVASPTSTASPNPGFQSISLNIVSVRLNPSTNANVADSDPNWKVIAAPPGANAATGGTLNLNLADLQANAAAFNTGKVAAQTYQQVEVVVDATFPGSVTPACVSGSTPAFEGCVSYPLTLTNGTNLRTSATVPVSATGLATLVININPTGLTPPAAAGGHFTASPTISVAANSFLGTLSGTVAGVPKSGATITAETAGTNLVVASAPVASGGSYTIDLPAAETLGTAYDLFVAGSSGSSSFGVASSVVVTRGTTTTQDFTLSDNPGNGTVSGTIISSGPGTSGQSIPGATVNLLRATGSTDCQTSFGAGCVVVETTTASSIGSYSFTTVPFGKYFAEAQATGSTIVIQPLTLSSGTASCTGSPISTNCSFNLPNNVITGFVAVEPPATLSNSISVTVLAEQHDTGNLVGLVPLTVRSGSAPFTLQVPTEINGESSTFDLIATAQDTYLGIGSAFTGHNQAVASNIAGSSSASPAPIPTMTVQCLGHGTIAGTVLHPDSGSHVRLFQDANAGVAPTALVQLQDAAAGQTSGFYAFCAPPGDDYFVERFEQTSPTSSPSAVATPQGPITVATPAPAPTGAVTPGATPTPCPLCQNSAGQCPGNCSATLASPL